ncbi:hypothetical protein P692DRAFT_20870574 [Suillus brevipes Sb2]|nr:hypothetical protein P692DRAFT_20870574 [Suillus brevipes Sb2]
MVDVLQNCVDFSSENESWDLAHLRQQFSVLLKNLPKLCSAGPPWIIVALPGSSRRFLDLLNLCDTYIHPRQHPVRASG